MKLLLFLSTLFHVFLLTEAKRQNPFAKKKVEEQTSELTSSSSSKNDSQMTVGDALGHMKHFFNERKSTPMFWTVTVGCLSALYILLNDLKRAPTEESHIKKINVVVVATGLPKKGMGWYHLTQLLEMKDVNVVAVVEPFFLDSNLCKEIPQSYQEFMASTDDSVIFAKSVEELKEFDEPTMCLIAGRTVDNPLLFKQCIEKGASVIYLEKPGAPSVKELEEMKSLADSKGVKVYMGYNKNVTSYVQNALAFSETVPNSTILFQHNNSYKLDELNNALPVIARECSKIWQFMSSLF